MVPGNATPLDCLYRSDRSRFAILSSGTNEAWTIHHNPASFETHMGIIIEDTLAPGIVPFLGTKADNFEEDNFLNAIIARPAMEYKLRS